MRELRRGLSSRQILLAVADIGFSHVPIFAVFWREFYPRFDAPMPPEQKRLLDFLAKDRFGPQYHAENGIVRFTQPQKLREWL